MELTKADISKITSLRVKKYRDASGKYVAEGVKIIKESVEAEINIELIVVMGSVSSTPEVKNIMRLAAKESIPVVVVKDKEFDKLSTLETPSGILAVINKRQKPYIDAGATYIILDSIKDPGNMGAIIRSADWFGINNIVIGMDSVDVYNPKVIQATMGSIFRMNLIVDQDLPTFIKTLKTQNYSILATSLEGKDSDLKFESKKIAILVGNETKGLNPALLTNANILYKIPGSGNAESLNVSVATGIVLFQLFGK